MDEFWKTLLVLVGPAGLTTIVAAYFGWRNSQHDDARTPAPQPIEAESPWMVQNLTEITLTVRSLKGEIAALTAAVNAIAVQVNNLASRRRDH